MEITVTSRKMEMTNALSNRIDEKIQGIKKYLDGVNDVHVVLSVEKRRHFAEIILNAKGYVVHCKEETDNMYSTIDRVIAKVEKQIKKHKDRVISIKSKKRLENEIIINSKTDVLAYEEEIKKNTYSQIIKSEKFDAKPIFLEEAGMQIKSSKNNFLVFRNASNNRINVLYFRNDKKLGLIDTE